MRNELEWPIYLDEAAEYEVRSGTMYVKWAGLNLAIPLPVLRECLRRCNKALAEWDGHQCDVVPITRKRRNKGDEAQH
jgi:hypothetical protein